MLFINQDLGFSRTGLFAVPIHSDIHMSGKAEYFLPALAIELGIPSRVTLGRSEND